MDRTQNREIRAKSDAVRFDDWYAEEITIVTVRPLDSTPVSKEQEQQLGVGVRLQTHPSLEANVRLTTTPQVSRESGRAGVLLLPSPLRTERAGFQALGSSNITFRNEFYDDSISVAKLGCP